MAISQDQVLEIVRRKGPLIPAVIAKDLGMDLLFAQAYLSELSSKKQILVSTLKIGGSPLYYVDGQQSKLQNFSGRLNEKDLRAYEKLKTQKVMRDNTLDPLTRVCLRQIKDFAVMLEVRVDEESEIFWRWYECSNEQVVPLIKEMIDAGIKKKVDNQEGLQKSEEAEPLQKDPIVQDQDSRFKTQDESQKSQDQSPRLKTQDESQKSQDQSPRLKTQDESQSPKKDQIQKKLIDDLKIATIDPLAQIRTAINDGDSFLGQIVDFFQRNKIDINSFQVMRKNSDAEFIVSIPSAVGFLEFYCKAKNKKKCNDGDISSAYIQGQLKKLPVLFLTTGELTKKAESMLSNEFNGLKVQRLG